MSPAQNNPTHRQGTAHSIAERFGHSAGTYEAHANVQRTVAATLARLTAYQAGGNASGATALRIFEVGCGTGLLSRELAATFRPRMLTLNDVSPEMAETARQSLSQMGDTDMKTAMKTAMKTDVLVGDAEEIAWPQADIVASASAVQWFAQPLAFVTKAAQSLQKGGIAAVATYGPHTFRELRGGEPDTATYPTADEWREAMTARFRNVTMLTERRTQTFASRTEMLRMMVLTGVGTRRGEARVPEDCRQLTYDVIYLVGEKK